MVQTVQKYPRHISSMSDVIEKGRGVGGRGILKKQKEKLFKD